MPTAAVPPVGLSTPVAPRLPAAPMTLAIRGWDDSVAFNWVDAKYRIKLWS